MSEGWFKADKKLPSSPKVIRLIALTGCDVETILGRLWIFWAWCDDHATDDGRLRVGSVSLLCNALRVGDETFWEALTDPEVNWLGQDRRGLYIPKWDKWFGEARRSKVANRERQKRYRERRQQDHNAHRNGTVTATNALDDALDETRRDETRTDKTRESSGIQTSLRAPTSNVAPVAPGAGVDAEGAQIVSEESDDWQEIRRLANSAVQLVPPATPADRSLLLKAACLSVRRFNENWWHDSLEAVRAAYAKESPPKVRRAGYLHGVLESRTRDEFGLELNALLASIAVAPDLLKPPERPPP